MATGVGSAAAVGCTTAGLQVRLHIRHMVAGGMVDILPAGIAVGEGRALATACIVAVICAFPVTRGGDIGRAGRLAVVATGAVGGITPPAAAIIAAIIAAAITTQAGRQRTAGRCWCVVSVVITGGAARLIVPGATCFIMSVAAGIIMKMAARFVLRGTAGIIASGTTGSAHAVIMGRQAVGAGIVTGRQAMGTGIASSRGAAAGRLGALVTAAPGAHGGRVLERGLDVVLVVQGQRRMAFGRITAAAPLGHGIHGPPAPVVIEACRTGSQLGRHLAVAVGSAHHRLAAAAAPAFTALASFAPACAALLRLARERFGVVVEIALAQAQAG